MLAPPRPHDGAGCPPAAFLLPCIVPQLLSGVVLQKACTHVHLSSPQLSLQPRSLPDPSWKEELTSKNRETNRSIWKEPWLCKQLQSRNGFNCLLTKTRSCSSVSLTLVPSQAQAPLGRIRAAPRVTGLLQPEANRGSAAPCRRCPSQPETPREGSFPQGNRVQVAEGGLDINGDSGEEKLNLATMEGPQKKHQGLSQGLGQPSHQETQAECCFPSSSRFLPCMASSLASVLPWGKALQHSSCEQGRISPHCTSMAVVLGPSLVCGTKSQVIWGGQGLI